MKNVIFQFKIADNIKRDKMDLFQKYMLSNKNREEYLNILDYVGWSGVGGQRKQHIITCSQNK